MKKQISEFTLESIGDFLAQYAERSDSVYWLSSPDFSRIVYVSPAYETIWGRSIDTLYADPKSWSDALVLEPGKSYNPIAAMAEKIAKDGANARYDENYRIWRPDGQIRWIMDHGFPVYDKQGNCCGVTGIATDITEIKEAEYALDAAKQRAESANRSKTEFLANITHELRTPLNGILGNTELLKNSEHLTTEEKEQLEAIEYSGSHLLSLIDELLDVTSVETGNIHLNNEDFNLHDVFHRVEKQCQALTNKKGLQLVSDNDNAIPKLTGDAKKLQQVIINLIGNAIKFTPSGKITFTSSLIIKTERTCQFEISVSDTGVGIPSDKLGFIFEKFSQLENKLDKTAQGFGLGLAITRNIIEKMGGNISAKSKINCGTTFTINVELPVANAKISTHSSKLPNIKILVVEDHPINQKIIISMLEKLGAQVDAFFDAQSTLDAFKKGYYDIILTDINLPDLSGCELSKKLHRIEPELPILAVTAHSHQEIKREAYEAGINEVLEKPLTQQLLLEKVGAWLPTTNDVKTVH